MSQIDKLSAVVKAHFPNAVVDQTSAKTHRIAFTSEQAFDEFLGQLADKGVQTIERFSIREVEDDGGTWLLEASM